MKMCVIYDDPQQIRTAQWGPILTVWSKVKGMGKKAGQTALNLARRLVIRPDGLLTTYNIVWTALQLSQNRLDSFTTFL